MQDVLRNIPMRKVGTSILAFGAVVFVSGVIASPFFDALTIDPLAVFLMIMGTGLRDGSWQRVRWPIILSGWYVVIGIVLVVVVALSPSLISVGKFTVGHGWPQYATLLFVLPIVAWAGVNIGILRRYQHAELEAHQ